MAADWRDHSLRAMARCVKRTLSRSPNSTIGVALRCSDQNWVTLSTFGDPAALPTTRDVALAPLESMLRYDQSTYLEELLMKQDTMSMAASLESRVPFLDHELVAWAATVPAAAKLRGWSGKHLVRLAAKGRLPDKITQAGKRGFLVPLDQWLRTVGRDVMEAALPTADDALLNGDVVAAWLQAHIAGRNLTGPLWRILALQVWRRETLPHLAALATDARRRVSSALIKSC